jgi:hypothetical protein
MRREKSERIVDICRNVHSLMVSYVEFVIMLTELKKMLSQELKCLCNKTATFLSVQKLWMRLSYIFIALKINKYITQKCMYTASKYIYCTQYLYIVQVHMSTKVIVIHYIG